MRLSVKIIAVLFFIFVSCSKDQIRNQPDQNVTIYFFNDAHAQLDNFAKIKSIVDAKRETGNVIVVSAGDNFSGNPVVDNYPEKGYPIIEMMNKVGVDIAELGNHEFDYGPDVLAARMEQSDFEWICANVDMLNSGIPEPRQYVTLEVDGTRITFLGFIETNGKKDATIPSTHPRKVETVSFARPEAEVNRFSSLKSLENSDLLIALTHLGFNGNENYLGDVELASHFPFFDIIIGGHSHQLIDTVINSIPVFQAGSYLNYLGELQLTIRNQVLASYSFQLINLNTYAHADPTLLAEIQVYNEDPYLKETIGYSAGYHSSLETGCFYTDALRQKMNVDLTFQNTGGIRSTLSAGDITRRDIFEIDPFSNGTVIYEMRVEDIKNFLKYSGSGFYYSGVRIFRSGDEIAVQSLNGQPIPDETILRVGINDYIPAVYETLFPAFGERQELTSSETIIAYLEEINNQVDYRNSANYFRY